MANQHFIEINTHRQENALSWTERGRPPKKKLKNYVTEEGRLENAQRPFP